MAQSLTTPFQNLSNLDELPSPTVIVFPERIKANIHRMIEIAGNPYRLRPHVKTHKMAEIVSLQQEQGIQKFKCSTLSEVRMLIHSEASDILMAMQPVGPDISRFIQLARANPDIQFAAIVDNLPTLEAIERQCSETKVVVGVYLDLNNGMNRTGIAPSSEAEALYKRIHDSPALSLGGIHVYDGHIRDQKLSDRQRHCDRDFEAVESFIQRVKKSGLPIPNIVAGGSPTFPIHARREACELSPGTTLLWDFGYGDRFEDLPFLHAALLFTRVLSKPAADLICLDLGHKAVAAEMDPPRVRLLGLEDATFVSQSEEHLVIQTSRASAISVGDAYLGIPRHICPTIALHNKVAVANDGRITDYWSVAARNRILD